jgi:hypothetical protein
MRVLQIIESAYRGTLEEQDDTIVWLTHCMRGVGADLTVLLKDNAVSYVLCGQDCSGLQFGSWRQTHPPDVAADLAALSARDVPVLVVEEDLARRGILDAPRIDGALLVARRDVVRIAGAHDLVWYW